MRHGDRLNSLVLTRGIRERLSPFSERLQQFDPLGVVDMNLPYPYMAGDAAYVNNGTTGTAKVGVLSSGNRLAYQGDNALGIRREYTYSGALSGLSVDGFPITNFLRDTENMSATYWTQDKASGLGTKNAIGPDGLTSAITITTTGTPATITQTRGAVGAGNKRFSVWLRRVSGSGTVEIACNTGSYTTVTVTSEWQRFEAFTTAQVVVGIRLTGTPLQVIEVFGATATRASSYYGNAPEIIHATGSDLTFSGNYFYAGTSAVGQPYGAFVFECCTQRQVQSDRTWNSFLICEAASGIGDALANLTVGFNPSDTTLSASISDGVDIDSSSFPDINKPDIVRAAGCWDGSGFRYSFNGGAVQTLSLDLSALTSAGVSINASGVAIRHLSVYESVLDNPAIIELSRVRA